jgi:hypothetical protein
MYQQFEDNFLNCMEIAVPKISKSSKKIQQTMLVESRSWKEKT